MRSGQAHAWLFIDLINAHLPDCVDPTDIPYDPDGCGPCGALRDYWLTPHGRAEAQANLDQLSPSQRQWTWTPGGVIDWSEIERRTRNGQQPMPLVTITRQAHEELLADRRLLGVLEEFGVDNWEGWGQALSIHTEREDR